MVLDNCLVKVPGIKANVQGAIWFLGLSEG